MSPVLAGVPSAPSLKRSLSRQEISVLLSCLSICAVWSFLCVPSRWPLKPILHLSLWRLLLSLGVSISDPPRHPASGPVGTPRTTLPASGSLRPFNL